MTPASKCRRSVRPIVLFATAAAALLLLLTPAASQADTFTVTKGSDTNDGLCNADCSLREAVNAANVTPAGDEVVVPAGNYSLSIGGAGEDAGATGDLDVTTSGTTEIRGTGAGPGATVITAAGLGDRIIDVLSTGEARILNLTLRGGSAVSGGAIQNAEELTIRRVAFEGNTASGNGGAIHSSDGTARITIEDSTFSGNGADSGGAIYNQDESTIVAARSVFSGNTATDRGGAIYNQNEAAFTLTDSRVGGNTATDDGGGIFTQNSSSLTIVRSALSGNTTGEAGGGIFVQNDSALSINETSINANTALGVGASDGGGAIYANNDSALLIERSTISGNRSEGDAGGISRNNDGQLLMNNSTVSDNSAAGNGGGLIFDGLGGGSFIALENTTVAGNTAGGLGGGIYNEGDPVLEAGFERTIIAANTSAGTANDCATDGVGVFTSNGSNLDSTGTCGLGAPGDLPGANPLLGPLADNGGSTQTRALLLGSQAIDAGGASCPPIDQREAARPQGAACDIGAFESTPDTQAPELELSGAKKQKIGKLAVKVSCDEVCTAVAGGKVTVKAGKGKKQSFKLEEKGADIGAGETGTLKLEIKGKKPAKKAKKAIKRARGGTAAISVTAADASGNETSAKRTVKLTR